MAEIKIKINHLINLHDARSCAAWGVEYLSFSLEKGGMRKLSETMVKEIVGWLSGVNLVLDYGTSAVENLNVTDEANAVLPMLQINATDYIAKKLPLPTFPGYKVIYSLVYKKLFWDYYEQIPPNAYIEVQVSKDLDPVNHLSDLKRISELKNPVFFNVDTLSLEFFKENGLSAYGFSARACVSQDLISLDFDKCETFIDAVRSF